MNVSEEDRKVVLPAREAALAAEKQEAKGNNGLYCGAALELPDGSIITGKNSSLMHASSSCILNAVKILAKLPDDLMLISPEVLEAVSELKSDIQNSRRLSLDMEEMMIALSVSASNNPAVKLAIEKLRDLRECEMHITHIPTPGDEAGLRKLGINLTCDPNFSSKNLFID